MRGFVLAPSPEPTAQSQKEFFSALLLVGCLLLSGCGTTVKEIRHHPQQARLDRAIAAGQAQLVESAQVRAYDTQTVHVFDGEFEPVKQEDGTTVRNLKVGLLLEVTPTVIWGWRSVRLTLKLVRAAGRGADKRPGGDIEVYTGAIVPAGRTVIVASGTPQGEAAGRRLLVLMKATIQREDPVPPADRDP